MGKRTIVITSGFFNPLAQNHLDYLWAARQLGQYHICIVNNDEQAILKKGYSFQKMQDRCNIMSALKMIDSIVWSIDKDLSVSQTLKWIIENSKTYHFNMLKYKDIQFIFANGGDVKEIREEEICKKYGCEIMFGVGGSDKKMSSSKLLEDYMGYIFKTAFKRTFEIFKS